MRMIVWALLYICGGLLNVAHAEALTPYLPKSGIVQGQVMGLVAPTDTVLIAKKMQDAISRDRAWFVEHVKKTPQGTPLAYDPRMGITKDEYARVLQMQNVMTMRPIGSVTVKFAVDADGKMQIAADGLAKVLNGISLPPGQKYVDTPLGQLSTVSKVSQNDPKSPLGRWSGIQWAKSKIGGSSITLAVGRRDETGEGVIYYNVTGSANGSQDSLIILYKID
jgi:hypothetical protein